MKNYFLAKIDFLWVFAVSGVWINQIDEFIVISTFENIVIDSRHQKHKNPTISLYSNFTRQIASFGSQAALYAIHPRGVRLPFASSNPAILGHIYI